MENCKDHEIPLVIDLDGTLLRSDILIESALCLIHSKPLQAPILLRWLGKGKSVLKARLAELSTIDVTTLPYDPDVVMLIREAKTEGRKIVLATASHQSIAEKIAAHLGLFDNVIASDEHTNLSAKKKKNRLIEIYGLAGFDYVGNSRDDLTVWQACRKAYIVNPQFGVNYQAKKLKNIETILHSNSFKPNNWIKALRLHQWLKNLLLFVPLLAAHRLTDITLLLEGIIAFICFGLCASSVYLLNDLLDLQDDRRHPRKRNRPLAAGTIPIRLAVIAAPLLLGSAFFIATRWISIPFLYALVTYYLLTLAYSFHLKRHMTIDVIALALLYTLRIIAGAATFALPLTFWILAFSMFIFLSLAMVKRYAELHDALAQGKTEKTHGRGYYPGDLSIIASLGSSAGYLSVMVLALYIHDQSTAHLYHYPELIWLACPILMFWITRIWILTHRGEMNDDPIIFAMRDRISLIVGVLFCLVFWGAS